jgi:O-antigen ligase
MGSILLGGAAMAVVGGGRVWSLFNRGQGMEGIETVSGRTDMWMFVIHYCMAHPMGMGYIAGFRTVFRGYFTLGLQVETARIGNAHNSYLDVLADAGWASLVIYLYLLFKIISLGWRYARKRAIFSAPSEDFTLYGLRCALAMLVFCLIAGMDGSDFCVPLRSSFYLQNIIIAMILAMSARILSASRARSMA